MRRHWLYPLLFYFFVWWCSDLWLGCWPAPGPAVATSDQRDQIHLHIHVWSSYWNIKLRQRFAMRHIHTHTHKFFYFDLKNCKKKKFQPNAALNTISSSLPSTAALETVLSFSFSCVHVKENRERRGSSEINRHGRVNKILNSSFT